MKRLTALSAALILASAAGLAQAQVSNDDFSVLTGPNAPQASAASKAPRITAPLVGNVEIEQGIVGPQASHRASTVTRAQVVREREAARAANQLAPGAEYLNVVGAPTTQQFAGSIAVPAGE